MSSILGFSRLQKQQLDDLKTRLDNAEDATENKQTNSVYNNDMLELDTEDTNHFTDIEELKETKADKIEFNSRVNQLTGNDIQHEEKMNELEGICANKVSQVEFDTIVAQLNANDNSQDARIDALEQHFTDIQSRIVEEITEKANELVLTADFNTMVANLQAGDTGLHNQIIQLASTETIENALTTYQSSLTTLQDKTPYDTEINKLVQRNYDFEQRLLGVDQFFRVLAETYKLHKDGQEVIYTADLNSEIIINGDLVINSYKSISSGAFNSEINVSLKQYLYNTLAGPLKVFVSGVEVGSATKSQFNEVSFVGDIQLYATTTELKDNGFTVKQYYSDSTEVAKEWIFTSVQVNGIPEDN